MNFSGRVSETDIILFAKDNLVGKYKKLRTFSIESERTKSGWFVEHKFRGENGKYFNEGYIFGDFAVIYVAGCESEAIPSSEYWQSVQQTYRDFMIKQFGNEYVEALNQFKADANEKKANEVAKKQERASVKSYVDRAIASNLAGNSLDSKQSESDCQQR